MSDRGLSHLINLEGRTLNMFGPENKFRMLIAELVQMKFFDTFIIILITCSTITLALEKPLNDPDSDYNNALYYCDLAFSICFGVECLLKIIAFGLVLNKS